jgi:hypothetical protein
MPADRDHLRCLAEVLARCLKGLAGIGGPLTPGRMPHVVLLYVEERSLDGPVQSLSKHAGVAVAPVRPRVAPPWCGDQGESRGEKGTVIVGELEPELLLYPRELRVSQTWGDLASANTGQAVRGFLAQSCRFTADHARTLAPERVAFERQAGRTRQGATCGLFGRTHSVRSQTVPKDHAEARLVRLRQA